MTTTSAGDKTRPRPNSLARVVPILQWLPHYDRSWLRLDIIAGLTLWGLVLPEAMAYAGVAGLPPQAGLYTLVVSLLVYAILGSSRHLVVQATSASAALLASSVAAAIAANAADASDPAVYQTYATAFVFVVGLVFLVAAVARLGFITQFLSKPVMDGFVTGLAIYVAVGQLNKLFGVEKPSGNTVEKFFGIIKELPQANWAAFAVGATALVVLIFLPRFNKKIPAGLVVLFGAIVLSSVLALEATYGVEVVGALPQGLPRPALPQASLSIYLQMVLPAVGVLLVAFSQSLGVSHEFAEKHGYEVSANQELTAHALTNLTTTLFGGMIAAGAMSGSAVKEGAGAKSQVSNLVTWAATVVTLLFLTPLFESLPEAVLGALIIHALWHIIASRKLQRVRQTSRVEFVFGLLALLGVIFIDVLEGMLIGVLASLVFVIYKSSRPHVSSLGQVPSVPGAYGDLQRHSDYLPVPGVLIVRLDAPMYYANALTVRERVKELAETREDPLRAVVLDSAGQDELDLTSLDVLKSLVKEMQGRGIAVYAADVHAPVLEAIRKAGLLALIGEDHVFHTVDAAVRQIESH